MSGFPSSVPLLIIGAGAAGLGASEKARELGIEHLVIEASHRLGGRGLTEMLNNTMPVDLGCHWMHCGSRNGFVQHADAFGFRYDKDQTPYRDFVNGDWQPESFATSRRQFVNNVYDRATIAAEQTPDAAVIDCIDQENPHATWSNYWFSLMHSNDADLVSVNDVVCFEDTYEDWPLEKGYGALISAYGANAPVSLNTVAQKIDTRGPAVTVETSKGTITADKVIVTVSTGVLGAGDIEFLPSLPITVCQAISDLPLGNYNYLFYALQPGVIPPESFSVAYERDELATSIRLREFGRPMLSIPVGGRFAWWLEGQSEQAIESWGRQVVTDVFGSEAERDMIAFKRSAWGYDNWVKGAYSSAKPGSGTPRLTLMEPVNDRLWFAGEAISEHVINTAHGARESGQRAVVGCSTAGFP